MPLLDQWRAQLPSDSIFRQPLVFEIVLVLILKVILLLLLWQFAFKPLLAAQAPNMSQQILSSPLAKDPTHE